MKTKIHLSVLLLISVVSVVQAANLSIEASLDRTVIGRNEQAVLQVQVSGDTVSIPEPKIPALSNFTITGSGRSQSISVVNGHMSGSITFNYMLTPNAVGSFTIPPIVVEDSGKTWQTQPIGIKVTAGNAPAAGGQQQQYSNNHRRTQNAQQSTQNKEIFVEANVDKKSCFVNEQLTYTFRFYYRARLTSNPAFQKPSFEGFWMEEFKPTNGQTTVNGTSYAVSELKVLLFPTKAGLITIDPALIQVQAMSLNGDPFSDDFFANAFGGKTVTLKTLPITINVHALPTDGKPADFNGAVGDYTVSAVTDKNKTKVNDAITLSFTVSGEGNIKTIPEPVLPNWQDIKKYDTTANADYSVTSGSARGSKVFKSVLSPLSPGKKIIPALSFTFFDPKTKAYRTASTKPITLDVAPGNTTTASSAQSTLPAGQNAAPSSLGMPSVTLVNRDIRFLKTLNKWQEGTGPLVLNNLYLALAALPLPFGILTLGYYLWQRKLRGDVAFARSLSASGVAKKYLKSAAVELKNKDVQQFYAALSRSVTEYIAHKLNVSPEGATVAALSEAMAGRNIPEELRVSMAKLLEECDLVRFAPTQTTPEMMQASYNETAKLLSKLDKAFK